VVESGSLENCCALTGTVGSNPTLSAILRHGDSEIERRRENWFFVAASRTLTVPASHQRKGARVVELAALEML
jgi:hypothetical protein